MNCLMERVMTKMSNSPLVTYTKISPNHNSPRNKKIDRITPHCIMGQCSIETLGNIFAPVSRQGSSNYGIGPDGRVGMYVEEGDRSWCTSSGANDHRAVTIECASDSKDPYAFSDTVYLKLIELCVDICKRNGKTKLIWINNKNTALNYQLASNEMLITVHRWFDNRSCPGDWLVKRMGDFANEVTKQLNPPLPVEPEPAEPSGEIKQGSKVTFAGGKVYVSSTATTSKVIRGKSECEVTIYKKGAAHPCHCISTDNGGVYGWVDLDKCTLVDDSPDQEGNPYLVKITASVLHIRKGPGTNYDVVGSITDKGVYTIVETKGKWGRLKSGAGWIYLDYTTKV